jgi:hypothetical protein
LTPSSTDKSDPERVGKATEKESGRKKKSPFQRFHQILSTAGLDTLREPPRR